MRKFVILGIAVVLGGAALLIPAGGGATPIGSSQPFEGRVNNAAGAVVVPVEACGSNGRTQPRSAVTFTVRTPGVGGLTGVGANAIDLTLSGGWSFSASVNDRQFNSWEETITVAANRISITCTGPVANAGTATFSSNGSAPKANSTVAITGSSS